jgi:hypothetical protein
VYINKTWPGGLYEGKTLTEIILKKSDLSFVAFGYEARDLFASLEDKEREKLLYFSTFKMILHSCNGSRKTVKAENCDFHIQTEKLLAECIKVMMKRSLNELSSATSVISERNVKWVITVPAIWVELR